MEYFKLSRFEQYWKKIFKFGIYIKGINGLWETIGGCLLLFTNKNTITNLFYSFVGEELLEDPNDFIVNFLGHAIQHISLNTKIFIALYILLHGIINLFLVIQLHRNKLWSYVLSIVVMGVFMLYQIYRISLYHSVALIIITIFDLLFILLTWHEYNQQKSVFQATR